MRYVVAALLAALMTASSAVAAPFFFLGPALNTAGQPTYARTGASFGVDGTIVNYQATNFNVTANDTYLIRSYTQYDDSFAFLYGSAAPFSATNPFNPASPATNGVVGNDDIGALPRESGFNTALVTTNNYTFVQTSRGAGESGSYFFTVLANNGIGEVTTPGPLVPVEGVEGNTKVSPTFNRPNEDGSFTSEGTNVRYDVYTFVADFTGSADVVVATFTGEGPNPGLEAASPAFFDSFLLLYDGVIDPSTATTAELAAFQAANDDYGDDIGARSASVLTGNFVAGQTYTVVVTGLNSFEFGRYGVLLPPSAIPEPSTYALLALGLVGGVVLLRRRSAAAVA